MKIAELVLVGAVLVLSSGTFADDLFPLDSIPLGMDVNSVKALGMDINWEPFGKINRTDSLNRMVAFVKIKSQYWDVAMLAFTNGHLDLVGYSRVLAESAASKELVRQIYTDLVTRCGKPDQVVASGQAITDGTRNAPIFVWNKKERTIIFTYTPLAAVTYDDKQTLALQITLPEKQLSERCKIVEVSAAEMERLTVDVACITAPEVSPSPIANGTTGQGRSPYLWPVVGAIVVAIAAGFVLVKKAGRPR